MNIKALCLSPIAVALIAGSGLMFSGCGTEEICKENPAPGTTLPAGSSCQKECNKIKCPNCCDNTTTGRANEECKDKCGSMAAIVPGPDIFPEPTRDILTAAGYGEDISLALQHMSGNQLSALKSFSRCGDADAWNNFNDMLIGYLPFAGAYMEAQGVDASNPAERGSFFAGAVSEGISLVSPPGGNTCRKFSFANSTHLDVK